MKRMLKRLLRDTDAQDLAEYGIALAAISALVGVVVLAVGSGTRTVWTRALQAVIGIASGN
jgi:Flp pilus assembly pilin Flp